MTIIVATRDFIASDSLLASSDGAEGALTVGKIFKRKGGGLFATAGDSRLTYPFEKAMRAGKEPSALDLLEDEDFAAVLLLPDRTLTYYDSNFAPFPFSEHSVALGCAQQVARSWLKSGAVAVEAIKKCIEVDSRCGYPIVVAYLDGRTELIGEDGSVTEALPARKRGKK